MNAIEQIEERLANAEQAKREKQLTNFAAYRDMLIDLARDQMVDEQELLIVLDMVDKSFDELKTDIALMKKRIEWSNGVKAAESLRQKSRELSAEKERLWEEFNRVGKPIQDRIFETEREATRANLQADGMYVIHGLLTRDDNLLNPGLIAEESEVRKEFAVVTRKADSIKTEIRKIREADKPNLNRIAELGKQLAPLEDQQREFNAILRTFADRRLEP